MTLATGTAVTEDVEDVLALWREAEAVPGATDDPAALLRLLDTSSDALLVAWGRLHARRPDPALRRTLGHATSPPLGR